MRYLVDANVLSETTKRVPNPEVVAWLSSHEPNLVIDPIVLGELQMGILRLKPGRKRESLEHWFDSIIRTMNCLNWDAAVGLRWARLVDYLRKQGLSMPIVDGMIAASALHLGLTVATRNVRDFEKCGVKIVDPFS